jgi:cytochrome c oxidase assembly factor CtaG
MRAGGPSLSELLGSWAFDPWLLVLLAGTAVLYGIGVWRAGHWPPGRSLAFLAGLTVLAFALLSGVDRYSDRLLSVHMLQHLLLMLVAPALLCAGAPVRLGLRASGRGGRVAIVGMLGSRAVRVLARPASGFTVFAIVVLVTHLTGVFQLALEHPLLHELEHAVLFWSGALLLAPLIAADPVPRPPGPIARFCWLMEAMTAMAIPGALLTFATGVRYHYYLTPTRALGHSPLGDEHLAGAIMWVGGGLAMFALALTLAMRAMFAEEARQRRREHHEQQGATGVLRA